MSKYKSLQEWRKADRKAYEAAEKRGLIDKICEEHNWIVPIKSKPKGFWTLEKCKEEALKYVNKAEWRKCSPITYTAAQRGG